ncbi:hypothetical protein [Halorubrum salinum]|uniref:hypothetical protein n=1 Tax=Halorubrum salinum TaxID=767517 RepID=UPI002111D28E|nr:hypothetical protein [Halorubrum salinum]
MTQELYGIRLIEEGDVRIEFQGPRQVDPFVDLVNHLLSEYNLESKIQPLPYIPGTMRPIIHDQTSHGERKMKQPRELVNGYYLELNLSAEQKQREVERLVRNFAFEVQYTGKWD